MDRASNYPFPVLRPRCRTHLHSAFSLVEIMVAILILGVALVGLVQGLTTALGASKESELQTTAALLAAGQIETLRAEGYLTDGSKEGDCGDELPRYQWRQTISPAAINGLHEVEVVVENSKSGQSIYELRTLLFDPPPASDDSPGKKNPDKSKKKAGKKQ